MASGFSGQGTAANKTAQMVGVWSGFGFVFLFFLASWPMAHFIPPPSPLLSGHDLIARYADNIFMVRAAMPIGLIAGMLAIPFSTTIAIQIARLEEGRIPFYAITSFGAGIANGIVFFLPFIFWSACYYRLDRPGELVRLLSDMSWLEYLMVWPPLVMQMLSIAIPVLSYKGPKPHIIPRWFGFLSIWISVLIAPASLCVFFYSGPFSWVGIISWWIPCLTFAFYWLVLVWVMRKAVINHAAEATA